MAARGRPPVASQDERTFRVSARLNQAEVALLDQYVDELQAAGVQTTRAGALRDLALHPDHLRATRLAAHERQRSSALVRLGRSLEHLAGVAQGAGQVALEQELRDALAELRALYRHLRRDRRDLPADAADARAAREARRTRKQTSVKDRFLRAVHPVYLAADSIERGETTWLFKQKLAPLGAALDEAFTALQASSEYNDELRTQTALFITIAGYCTTIAEAANAHHFLLTQATFDMLAANLKAYARALKRGL